MKILAAQRIEAAVRPLPDGLQKEIQFLAKRTADAAELVAKDIKRNKDPKETEAMQKLHKQLSNIGIQLKDLGRSPGYRFG